MNGSGTKLPAYAAGKKLEVSCLRKEPRWSQEKLCRILLLLERDVIAIMLQLKVPSLMLIGR